MKCSQDRVKKGIEHASTLNNEVIHDRDAEFDTAAVEFLEDLLNALKAQPCS